VVKAFFYHPFQKSVDVGLVLSLPREKKKGKKKKKKKMCKGRHLMMTQEDDH